MSLNAEVVIIGGGASGWCLATELAHRGFASLVIDVPPVGQYATTSNQGWLHSGALYMSRSTPDASLAVACREGRRLLLKEYDNDLAQPAVCYLLFYHEEERDIAIQGCRDLEIVAEAVPIDEVRQREPLLHGSPLQYAMRVTDCPIDSARFLKTLVERACAIGVQFAPVNSLETLQITRDEDSFSLLLDTDSTIACKYVVFACGAMIPAMLARLVPAKVPRFRITKNPVLSLSSEIALAKSMLIIPNAPNGLSLVPFQRETGNGISICTLDTEQFITDYHDRGQSNEWEQQLMASIAGHFPAMKMLALEQVIRAYTHVCQKLHLHEEEAASTHNRRPLYSSYALEDGGPTRVFALYAGKMTSAFIPARMCADDLQLASNKTQTDLNRAHTMVPEIARQPYGEHYPAELVLEHGVLALKKID